MNSRLDAQENDDKSVNKLFGLNFLHRWEKWKINWPMNWEAREILRRGGMKRGEKKEAKNERGINLPASVEFAARDEDDIFPL